MKKQPSMAQGWVGTLATMGIMWVLIKFLFFPILVVALVVFEIPFIVYEAAFNTGHLTTVCQPDSALGHTCYSAAVGGGMTTLGWTLLIGGAALWAYLVVYRWFIRKIILETDRKHQAWLKGETSRQPLPPSHQLPPTF